MARKDGNRTPSTHTACPKKEIRNTCAVVPKQLLKFMPKSEKNVGEWCVCNSPAKKKRRDLTTTDFFWKFRSPWLRAKIQLGWHHQSPPEKKKSANLNKMILKKDMNVIQNNRLETKVQMALGFSISYSWRGDIACACMFAPQLDY